MIEHLSGQLSLEGVDPLQDKEFTVRKRDGRVVPFDETRVLIALESAFKAEQGLKSDQALDNETQGKVQKLAEAVIQKCLGHAVKGDDLGVERIQDVVETQLMADGYHSVARRYIVYREERKRSRALRAPLDSPARVHAALYVALPDGSRELLDVERIARHLAQACRGLEKICSTRDLAEETIKNLYDGVRPDEIDKAMILAAKARIEREPAYSYVAARLLLGRIYREVLGMTLANSDVAAEHRSRFSAYISKGVRFKRLSSDLLTFDLDRLAEALHPERDEQFTHLGLQTLYDRYLLHQEERRIETPQYFWMRVAMGLALNEKEREERAIEFYEVLSAFRFVSSTPTLFNSGTLHPQLSSCYLSTVMDDLEHIFKVIADDARLSKWAGGLGNDWTNVRATGSLIRGTNGESQGVIPFLKVANDTAVAVNQGGKRKGAMCAYLETWHLDIGDFLELRKNTGDERRRTHDMNTANWIPDLFMKRVVQQGHWTLFSPNDVPDLHDLYGVAFERRYIEYEEMADRGEIKLFMRVEAVQLWRKMLTQLFETGHPWITFKDPSNVRSPQSHTGVVHSSNLCTEILLNTSADETAVCNLGSINLVAHLNDAGLDEALLSRTVRTAMRMLDNVVDINFYPTLEAKRANLRHRPVGLGLMGFQDALFKLRIPYASPEAVTFADQSMELISYHTILASTELARERGVYPSFRGSKWDQGLLPIDTLGLLEEERGGYLKTNRSTTKDWAVVRSAVKRYGMRNSNCMAIAPTATISNIVGVSQSIEPLYKNLFAKSNLSGDFTTINTDLIAELKTLNLWDEAMVDDLKYFDGSIQEIERIPQHLKEIYRTAFEIEPQWLIECASRRQKWIDMGQSLNLYIAEPSGKKLNDMYLLAWESGLKTTYYLRSQAATQVEKSTSDINRRGIQPRWVKNKSASSRVRVERESSSIQDTSITSEEESMTSTVAPKACSILDPGCESCQ